MVCDDPKVLGGGLHYDGSGDMHVKNAILICDIHIEQEYFGEFYPYSAWYCNALKSIRYTHYINDRVPIRLGDIQKKARALLWHDKRIYKPQCIV